MEFSKKIIIISGLFYVLIATGAIGVTVLGKSTDVFIYLIPTTGTILATSCVAYYNKAKAENLKKGAIKSAIMKWTLAKTAKTDEEKAAIEEGFGTIDSAIQDTLRSKFNEALNEEVSINSV